MGWREFLKGRNQPPPKRHGGSPADNGSGRHQGRSDNAAKQKPKKPKGNGGK